MKNQNLSELAESLRNHSLELKDEVEVLQRGLDAGQYAVNPPTCDDVMP